MADRLEWAADNGVRATSALRYVKQQVAQETQTAAIEALVTDGVPTLRHVGRLAAVQGARELAHS